MSINNTASITRKRTRDDAEAIEIDARPIVITDSSHPFAAPRTFTPTCLLSRAQLPLAFLDTAIAGSRIFSAHVPALEASHEHGDDTDVLVARARDDQRLYAIERVQRRCYALCRLGEWVTEAEVKERSRLVLNPEERPIKRQAARSTETGSPWWKCAAVDLPSGPAREHGSEMILPRLAMERVVEAPQKNSMSKGAAQEPAAVTMESARASTPDILNLGTSISTEDVIRDLAKHYLEALYLSRTSLAYFTKGPLFRARAAFTMPNSSSNIPELHLFLRECVLSAATMDKKYRDGIAALVKEMPLSTSESPDKTPAKPARKKKKKWKPKRDKDGFFTDESEFVERWWRAEDENEPSVSAEEKMEAAIRRRATRIRNRETFLQIILVLEILSLEAAYPPQPEEKNTAPESQDIESQQADTQGAPALKKPKARKRVDLPALLETLLDKLCIWHSLESHSPAKKVASVDIAASDEQSDELNSFCVEVIVPFYSSRIPSYAAIVNKKLGGPAAPTPVKHKPSSARKPGEPAMRQPPEKKSKKPLARVSTDTANRPPTTSLRRPPTLQRSVTDSETTLYIKLEASEVPMDSIPPIRGHSRRASLFAREVPQLIAFSKREVDLSAQSAANEAKMRKKKDVEAKLKEAVEMLKKPNRAMAVKEIEARTDDAFTKAMAKAKQYHRSSLAKEKMAGPGVEKMERSSFVASTPRRVHMVKATPHKASGGFNAESAGEGSRATTHVTSSSSRLTAGRAEPLPMSTPAIPQTGHRPRFAAANTNVEETPSRGFAKFMPAGLARQPGTLESPVMKRSQMVIQQTPSKSSLPRLAQPLVAASPNVARVREVAGGGEEGGSEKSVYRALGWDEDGYDELL